MAAVTDIANWAKQEKVFWPESYLISLFPQVLTLSADKERKVQLKAEAAGDAMVRICRRASEPTHLFFLRACATSPPRGLRRPRASGHPRPVTDDDYAQVKVGIYASLGLTFRRTVGPGPAKLELLLAPKVGLTRWQPFGN